MGRLEISKESHLRPLAPSDAEELHALIEVNRAHLSLWLPWAAGQTFGHTVDFIRRTREQLAANDGFQAALVTGEELAGVVGYHGVDWNNRRTAIGYWLSEEWQGKGMMTAAVRFLTEHALSSWELNRVEIRAAVENWRSRAIPERLGFREEATMRRVERVGDRQLDCVVYAMVAGDALYVE